MRMILSPNYKPIWINRRTALIICGLVVIFTFISITLQFRLTERQASRMVRYAKYQRERNAKLLNIEWMKRNTTSIENITMEQRVPKGLRIGDIGDKMKLVYQSKGLFPNNDSQFADFNTSIGIQGERYQGSEQSAEPKSQPILVKLNTTHLIEKPKFEREHFAELLRKNEGVAIPYNSSVYPSSVDIKTILKEYKENGFVRSYKSINNFLYEPIFNPKNICKKSETENNKVFLLYIVKSDTENIAKRNTLRQTWADTKRFPNVRTVFSLGLPSDFGIAKRIRKEKTTYGDILLMNYTDTYNNLTLKTISGLNWAAQYCSQAKYVISVDDDMYVATDLVLKHLQVVTENHTGYFYSGMVYWDTEPIRQGDDYSKKWVLTLEEYPFNVYPPYVFGGFIMMSMETVKDMRTIIPFTKLLRIEDVYIGVVANKLGIVPIENKHVDNYMTFTSTEKFIPLLASHFYKKEWDLRKAWECHLGIVERNLEKALNCEYVSSHIKKLQTIFEEISYLVNPKLDGV